MKFKNGVTGHYIISLTVLNETQAPYMGFRIIGTDGEVFLESKDREDTYLYHKKTAQAILRIKKIYSSTRDITTSF
jgi:hypothetical protein